METTRALLKTQILEKGEQCKKLEAEIVELYKQSLLLCDEEQRFEEKTETWGRGKSKREVLAGRIYWKENFLDEDTGSYIEVERNQVVRIDGKWSGE